MTMLRPIKDLVHKAVSVLEAPHFAEGTDRFQRPATGHVYSITRVPSFRPGRFRPPAAPPLYLELLLLVREELIAMCNSPQKVGASLLANVVIRIALEKKVPTLLVARGHSLILLAVNLLLCRAGISLDKAINPNWDEHDFARLTIASAELAGAPLLLLMYRNMAQLQSEARAAMETLQTRLIVMDRAEPDSFDQLSKLSNELGLPITVASQDSG